ncbi:MAG: TonB-dependent receptor [Phenylobacterium sp.]|nr:MAG: TonB-dependent receptor [Phenylobacterium sp.]
MRWIWAALLMGAVAPTAWTAEPPAAASSSVISYPAAFFAPMGLSTAYDMVQRVPGFTFDDGATVRGFAGAAGNVLIDGQRPASKTDDLASLLTRLPAGQVERIDLIRGAQPGIDMQGKAVVANVIRRAGQGFTGVAAVGQYTTGDGYTDPQARLEGTWRGDDRVAQASLFYLKGHDNTQGSGPHVILGPDGQVLDASAMHNTGPSWVYRGTAAYEAPLFGGRVRANLALEDQPFEAENRDDFRVAGPQDQHVRQDPADGELGLHYDRDLAPGLALELVGLQHLNRTRFDSTFDTTTDDQRFSLLDRSGESIARAVLHGRRWASLTIDAGGEFAYNWLTTRTAFSDNGVPIQIPAANVRVTEQRGEGFVTAAWRPLAALSVEAGARVEASTIASTGDVALTRTLVFPKPRLLVTWSPDARDQFRVRIEREVGQLDFNSFVAAASLNGNGVAAGNPNLVPQQDWAFEAAYDRHFWTDGVASLTVRRLVLTDVIDRVPVFAPSGVFDEPGNIGGGRETDLVASFTLPLDRFGISGGTLRGLGTWRVSEVVDPTTGVERRISGQHPLDAELHVSQDLPRWKLSWGVDVGYGYLERFYRFDEIDSNRTNTVATLFVDYKPSADLDLRVTLDTNRGLYQIERQVYGGPRNLAPLQFIDVQDRRFGPVLFTRLRKTFG